MTEFLHEWVGIGRLAVPRADDRRRRPATPALTSCAACSPATGSPSSSTPGPRRGARRSSRKPGSRTRTVPVVVQRNGRVLVDPTNVEIANAYGATTSLQGSREFDVTVVGAGPSGLAAAVYAVLGGIAHPGDRARDDRRAGRVELADPQLPRLPARDHRRRPRAPGPSSRRGCSARPSSRCARPWRSDPTATGSTCRRRTAPRSRPASSSSRWGSATGGWASPPSTG